MPKYTCTKCNATGYSKNIATRSFFPDDQMAAMLTNVFCVTSVREERGWKVTFTARVYDPLEEGIAPQTADQAEMTVADWIAGLTLDQRTHWLCDHQWHTDEEPDC